MLVMEIFFGLLLALALGWLLRHVISQKTSVDRLHSSAEETVESKDVGTEGRGDEGSAKFESGNKAYQAPTGHSLDVMDSATDTDVKTAEVMERPEAGCDGEKGSEITDEERVRLRLVNAFVAASGSSGSTSDETTASETKEVSRVGETTSSEPKLGLDDTQPLELEESFRAELEAAAYEESEAEPSEPKPSADDTQSLELDQDFRAELEAAAHEESDTETSEVRGGVTEYVTELSGRELGFHGLSTDNLRIIDGIGPKMEAVLHENGIMTWADVAAESPESLRAVLDRYGNKYRIIDPASWIEQAQLAHQGSSEELIALQKQGGNSKLEKLISLPA